MRSTLIKWFLPVLLTVFMLPTVGQESDGPVAHVVLLPVNGPIGPAVSDFVERGLRKAAEENRRAVIIRMDTPGGLDSSMRDIIKAILSSPLPVIVYVAPSGARAASAGTYILYASHVAVMAPATNVGAATPIAIAPDMRPPGGQNGDDEEGKKEPGATQGSALERKVVNDAVAYLRGLAELRNRNPDWAEDAVREGFSLSAEEALERGVVDTIAQDVDELLRLIDGRSVTVAGREVTLDTDEWTVTEIEPDWRSQLLAVITNPNVAYILLLLGVYGLMFEFYSPGAIVPGVLGAISLLLALYAFQVLPVNYAGAALVVLGVALMAAELITPSFGALGLGGIAAFVIGSITLLDTEVDGLAVSMPLIVTVTIVAAALFISTVLMAVRQRTRPIVTGLEEMLGSRAEALESFSATGPVRIHGELWQARATRPIRKGQMVRVTRVDGLVLDVKPPEEGN